MSRARDFADLAGSADAGGLTGRNLIINGAMEVSQRGTTFASTANVAYTLDRMQWYDTGAGVVDISQSTDTPNGNFKNSLKVDITTADSSLAAGDLYNIIHQIEGYNIAHLGWGTSDAKTVTLSFHIKSPKTGTHCVTLRNSDQTRTRVEEFTINSADTWEKKTITITGDTSGTWQSTTSAGIQLIFPLALGSTYHSSVAAGSWGNGGNIYGSSNQVNCMDNASNNWYITGVQLEVGETATPFEHRSYADTIRQCRRYFSRFNADSTTAPIVEINVWSTATKYGKLNFPVEMRTNPTFTASNLSHFTVLVAGSTTTPTSFSVGSGDTTYAELIVATASFGSPGQAGWVRIVDTSGYADLDAEL